MRKSEMTKFGLTTTTTTKYSVLTTQMSLECTCTLECAWRCMIVLSVRQYEEHQKPALLFRSHLVFED